MGKARNIADLLNSSGKIDSADIDSSAQFYQFKNRIINGAMMIDQRNAGASVTPTSDTYTIDRWIASLSVTSKFSVQQNAGSITPPVGFTNYLGVTSLSAYSVGTSEQFTIQQRIEGLNVADLGWGTANAQTVTLSFWVRSSLTGTFGGSLRNSASNRSYPFTYTISTANTWEQKSVTIAGDTSGTWLTTNGVGIRLGFGLGVGSTLSGTAGSWAGANYNSATGATSVVGTSGATFYITGVQLEKGSTATSWDTRSYGTELALCQRYCVAFVGGYNPYLVGQVNSNKIYAAVPYTMRATPTATYNAINANDTSVSNAISAITFDGATGAGVAFNATSTGLTSGRAGVIIGTGGTSYLIFSAEL